LKIAVISDPHLGAKWGTKREQDSFDQMREAVERALQLGAQMILIPGDIFDTRIPRQEVWARAMRILALPHAHEQSEVELEKTIDKNRQDISPVALRGVPIVAVHGNHERRIRGLVNPVEALEAAGLLIYLHHNVVIFKTPVGKLAIHGMGNVPERNVKDGLSIWNPKPVKGAINILMLHQAVGQYVYSEEEYPGLDLADLPRGFDVYIDGHMHYHAEARVHGRPLLFPGSTIRTQLLEIEAQVQKGFYMLDIGEDVSYKFIELKSVRDFHYAELKFEGATISQLEAAVREKIQKFLDEPRKNKEKLPLIRLRLLGTLAKDSSRSDFDENLIVDEFSDRALVFIGKDELVAPGIEEKIKFLRELRERRLPVEDMAMQLLEENLRESRQVQMFDVRELYQLLMEDRVEEARDKVLGIVNGLVEAEMREERR
jgi:DNA repair exonuclease SbcCD nuclease subunit